MREHIRCLIGTLRARGVDAEARDRWMDSRRGGSVPHAEQDRTGGSLVAALRFRLRIFNLLACFALLSGLYGTAAGAASAASAPPTSAPQGRANGALVVRSRAHIAAALPLAYGALAGHTARTPGSRSPYRRPPMQSGLARYRRIVTPRPVRIMRVHDHYLPVTASRAAPRAMSQVERPIRRALALRRQASLLRHALLHAPVTRILYHAQHTHLAVRRRIGPRVTCPSDVWEGPPYLNRYDNYVDNGQGICVYSSTSIHATALPDGLALSGVNYMESNLSVGGTLTFNAGMTLQVSTGELDVAGTLNANSVTDTITIASPGGAPNSWGGLAFWPGSSGTLNNVHLSDAGAGLHDAPGGSCCPHADIVIDNAAVSISNSTIDRSSNNGVEVEGGANPTFQSDAFLNNGTWGLHYDFVPASLTLVNSNLSASGNGNGNAVDVVPGGIAGRWTLSNAGLPLHVGGILGINAGAELDATAPTTLQIASELDVAGTFDATGTATSPISLTTANSQMPNSWGGLAFWPGSAGALDHVHISFAGSGLHDAPGGSCCPHADIVVNNANPTIANSTIDYSSNNGIEVEGGADPTLTNDDLLDNGTWGLHYDFTPSITFDNNGLVASGNGLGDVVDIAAGSITGTLIDNNPGPPIRFDGTIGVNAGAEFDVAAGMTVYFNGELDVAGTLNANGTASQPISLTTTSGQAPNSWAGVAFWPQSTGTLDHMHLSFAGSGIHDAPGGSCCPHADVVVNNANPTITNSTIDYSSNNGIEVEGGANPTLTNDDLLDNGRWPLHYDFTPSITLANNGLVASGNGSGDVVDIAAGGITGTLTLNNPGPPVRFDGTIGVNGGATFNIAAGMLVYFNGELDVAGALNALGSATSPVSLTTTSGQVPNSWAGVAFWPGSGGVINYTHLSFAGSGIHDAPGGSCCPHADITVNAANPTIANSTLDTSSNNGIEVEGGANPVLFKDVLSNNGGWPLRYDYTPSITLVNNGLVASGNGAGNYIDVAAGTMTGTLTDNNPGLPLRFDSTLAIATGATFNVAAGMTVYFNGELDVAGTFNANGTGTAPISLTTTSGQVPNSWGGIAFWPQSTGRLGGVHLSFAGSGLHDAPGGSCCPHADLVINDAAVTVTGSTIDQSSNNDVLVESNNVTAGEQAVLHADSFGAVPGGSFGVVNSTPAGATPVNATYNWWGDASGPAGAGSGFGVPVSTGVIFNPFLLAPPPSVHLALNPTRATPFQSIDVTGTNFGPTEPVKLYWDSAATTALTTTSANTSGSFVTHVTVPQTPAGTHTIIAVGQGSGLVAAAAVTVKPIAVLAHGSGHQSSANGVSGFGFAADETVTAYWLPGGLTLGHGTTNNVGSITSLTFTVPFSPTGTYYVYTVGQQSKAAAVSAFALTPALSITPAAGAHGSHATIVGSGFGAKETVTVKWDCASATCTSATVLGAAQANANGDLGLGVTLPASTTVGIHTIGAKGGTSGAFASTAYNVTS